MSFYFFSVVITWKKYLSSEYKGGPVCETWIGACSKDGTGRVLTLGSVWKMLLPLTVSQIRRKDAKR